MKIIRRGARADNGPSHIELKNLAITFENNEIVIRDTDILDFVTKSHHDYKMVLSIEEVSSIIDAVATFPEEEKNFVGKAFESKLKKLLALVQACVEAK